MNFWIKRLQALFLLPYDNDETYKTHKETFLKEGLQRYVCRHKILQVFQTGDFFIIHNQNKQ